MLLIIQFAVFYTVESVFVFIRACSTIFKASCTVIPPSYCVRWDGYLYSPVQLKTELKQRNKIVIRNYTQEESGLESAWTQNPAPLSSVQCSFHTLGRKQ